MISTVQNYSILLAMISLFAACQSDNQQVITAQPEAQKALEKILLSLTDSYTFKIDGRKDTTLVLEESGIIIKIPKGAILKDGKALDSYELYFTPILDPLSMMAHKVVTRTTDGGLLKTQGMFKLQVLEENTTIDKEHSISVQIPVIDNSNDYKIYSGNRNKNGLLEWENPREKALSPLTPISPNDFTIRNYCWLDKNGNLYYTNIYIQSDKEVEYWIHQDTNVIYWAGLNPIEDSYVIVPYLDSFWYTLASKWEGNLVSTLEFKKRYDWIIGGCNQKIFELYFDNIDKNMWELDSLAADIYEESGNIKWHKRFRAFQYEKYGKVPTTNKRNLTKRDINLAENYLYKNIEWPKNMYTVEVLDAYMYANLDARLALTMQENAQLQLDIENIEEYDARCATLFLGNSTGWIANGGFNQTNDTIPFLLAPIEGINRALLVVTGMKEKTQEFYSYISYFMIDKTQKMQKRTVKLELSSKEAFKKEMEKYRPSNLPVKDKNEPKFVNDCWGKLPIKQPRYNLDAR